MIIGFTGKAGSGKSTAANYLVDKGWVKVNMKDALMAEMKENFSRTLDAIVTNYIDRGHEDVFSIDDLFIFKPSIMRALMQEYGTEVRRGDNPSYWIDKWADSVERLVENGENVVVDDIRFLNEADAVKTLGGRIFKIIRTDVTDTGTHVSENEMQGIVADEILTAEPGGQDDLYKMLDDILNKNEDGN